MSAVKKYGKDILLLILSSIMREQKIYLITYSNTIEIIDSACELH